MPSAPAAVDEILRRAVRERAFPGGVLLVADGGEVVLRRAVGLRQLVPHLGEPVSEDTIYDVASLTKVVVTTSLVMRLIEAGRIALGTPAAAFVPELITDRTTAKEKEKITVRDLLAHASGLPAWKPFYERTSSREEMVALAAREPLERPLRASSVYSDLNFMLLGALVERAGGARLDALAAKTIFAPLGISASTTTFVDLAKPFRPSPVAPTELCPRRGLLVGEVHDDNCHAAGGVLGHAGLFSTVDDLHTFARALVLHTAFPEELVREFFTPCADIPDSTRRLGWDGPTLTPGSSQAGDLWPKSGVGHMGFTGCSLWIDPPRARWVILLTNRVHPSRDNQAIRTVRPELHDAVTTWLDGKDS